MKRRLRFLIGCKRARRDNGLVGVLCHASVLVLLALACGCAGDPYYDAYTRTKPKPEDIVGEYFPTKNTEDFILRRCRYPDADTKLVFRADGTFTAHRIPDCWMNRKPWAEPTGKYDSGSGKWRIDKHHEWWSLSLSFGPIKDFSNPDQFALTTTNRAGVARTWNAALRNGLGTEACLVREKPPYLIHLTIGDPDEGRGLRYEKKGNAK